MDLKDEQWAVVEPLMAFYGSCAPEHPGMTCPTGIRHTKRATAGSRNGLSKVSLKMCCEHW